MKCPLCRHDNPATARFCEQCAAALARVCASCGTALSVTARFCHACAHPTAAGADEPARFRAPSAYTPTHLAERILTSGPALEGERKQVSVLFADLKGSMELLADRDPEEARALLDPVLDLMMEAVHRYEGTVNQVMGDGIMALFGAPLAHEDHAVRACYAALRLQAAAKRYAERVQRTAGVPIQVRVGVNSGEVVVRSIGSDLRMDYTAVGQTTHLAARMEQMAMSGSILITATTLSLAEGFVQTRSLGLVAVRGLADPVEVHELVGAGPVRTRFQAATTRGLTRFVGRAAETEALRRSLERAQAGHGQVVALVGEPGVGKSRLVHEFTRGQQTTSMLVLASGSSTHDRSTAYLPVIELLHSYFAIDAREDARKSVEAVVGKVLSLDRTLEPALPALLALLELPGGDPQWETLDPPLRRHRTLDAIKRLLLRESRVQPLLLVLEDLHWTDAETQAVLDSLVESLPSVALMLLVTYRPEYAHAWAHRAGYTQLRVDPLPPESAERLLEALLGSEPGLRPLKTLLIERSEGTPFFLEESVRALVETGILGGVPGARHLARALSAVQVPATVQAILAARIDRLAPGDKRLLQAAAVIGRDVPFGLLRDVTAEDEDDLRASVGRLQAAALLHEAGLFPELEYTFTHALTHEVAYQSLLHERRRALHGRVVDAIEEAHGDRRAEHVERLAHHALRAERWHAAVPYLRQAGARAAARSATVEAVDCFTKGIEALTHLPDDGRRQRLELDLQIALGPALMIARGYGAPEVERAYERARELGRDVGEASERFAALHGLWLYHWLRGHIHEVRDLTREMLAVAEGAHDPVLRLVAHEVMGEVTVYLGEFEAARSHMTTGLAMYDPTVHCGLAFRYGGYDPPAACHVIGAHALWYLGQSDDALAWSREGLARARQLAHPPTIVFSLAHAAILHCHRRDPERTLGAADEAIAISHEHGIGGWGDFGEILRGWALAQDGRGADGIALIHHGLAGYQAVFGELESPLWFTLLADAHRIVGEPAAGLDAVAEALRRAKAFGFHCEDAELHRLRGELLLMQGPAGEDEAERSFRRAVEIAAGQAALSLELRATVSLARLLARRGSREDARRALAGVYARSAQGLDVADVRDCRALIAELS